MVAENERAFYVYWISPILSKVFYYELQYFKPYIEVPLLRRFSANFTWSILCLTIFIFLVALFCYVQLWCC